jgi:hypothetical protein
MTAHVETHAFDVVPAVQSYEGDSRAQLAASLRFEPSELRDFEMADKAAGQMMGKLLTFLFCVLLFLMTGVNIWMGKNASSGTDPHAQPAPAASAANH